MMKEEKKMSLGIEGKSLQEKIKMRRKMIKKDLDEDDEECEQAEEEEEEEEEKKSSIDQGQTSKQLLSLEEIINGQASDGSWNFNIKLLTSLSLLLGVTLESLENFKQNELALLVTSKDDVQILEILFITIVSLFALKEKFEDKEDEWQMIARKAKGFLKTKGIVKVEPLLKKIENL